MKKKTVFLSLLLFAAVIFTAFIIRDNMSFKVTEYTVSDKNLPAAFSGFRIAQVSDLHNASFGKDNCKLLERLKKEQPDIIVITGDLVDFSHTDIPVAVDFARDAVEIAPVYYVTGNHEAGLSESDYLTLKARLIEAGVRVFENEKTDIELDGEKITVMGVDDPNKYENGDYAFTAAVDKLAADCKNYTVLLSHRPEYFECYVQNGINLVLSGHTHAGQIRAPFIGALFAPGQGFFPEYDKGLFSNDDTFMIVSAGLGNSIIPLRIFNTPELVLIELTGT